MADRELSGLRAHRIGFVFHQFFVLAGVSGPPDRRLAYPALRAARLAPTDALRSV